MKLPDPQHEKFAQAMAVGRRRTAAYEEAGFTARGRAACKSGKRLLGKPAVAARISELRAEVLDEYRLNRREILRFLVDVIQTPAGQVPPGSRLCQSSRITKRLRSLHMPDKMKAAEMLAKLCGWFPADQEPGKVEVIVTIGPDAEG